MKKLLIAALGMLALASCAKQPCCQTEHPCYAYDATIYELNTRQDLVARAQRKWRGYYLDYAYPKDRCPRT